MTLVEMRGVAAGYGDRDVLHGCTLSLAAGEVVSVVGPNGAGKSTLVRVLAGLLGPRAGEVEIVGRPLRSLARAEIARSVAVVPQSFETLFPFTVREVVALGRTARLDALGRGSGDDRAAVARALAALELDALAERRVDGVSGGERQRAVLAMALAQETPVLLLDEPTVHLDPGHQLATVALLGRLARERGLAVLAVMHDLNLASLAERMVVLVDGRIVADGRPSVILDAELMRTVFGEGWSVARHEGRPVVIPG
jgi:ABC-type cobalamin/Fe3+-siderophores transport system ATPase subunit